MKRLVTFITLLLAAAGLMAVLATSALAASASPAASASAGPLKYSIGIAEDVDGVNPFSAWSSISWESFRIGYHFLTWYDANYQPVGDFATKWDISPDGKVWTFHTRPNVKWSDGQPMSARDVAFTYNLILRLQQSMYINYLTNVASVVAPDDNTVVITCSKPNATLNALYIPILPEHIWSKVPDKQIETFKNVPMVGSGPFQTTAVETGKYVIATRNPYYKDGFGVEPAVEQVFFNIYQTQDGMVADYKAGNLDAIVGMQASFYKSLGPVTGSTAVAAPALGFHELGFNCWTSSKSGGNPLLRDARIRQAINWAIDKPAIAEVAMGGLALPGTSVVSPLNTFYHLDVPADQQFKFDPEKAKQILTEAGYVDTNSDGIREAPNGKPLKFRLVALNEYTEDQIAAGKIHSYLKDVGIETTIQQMDESAFMDANYTNANDDLYLWSWGGDIDPGYMLSIFTTGQILNNSDSEYSNPAFDALFEQQAGATDPNQRKQLVDEAQKMLYNESPYSVLWYNLNLQAFRTDKWTGYATVPQKNGAPFWNMLRTTYVDLAPRTAVAENAAGSSHTLLIVIIVVVAVVVIAGVVALVLRRKPSQVEDE